MTEEVKDDKQVKDEEVKEQKKEPAKKTTQTKKQTTKKQSKPKAEPKELVHIDMFLQEVQHRTDLTMAQAVGFKAYMNGKHYAKDYSVFMTELEKYLDKKVG